MDRPEKLRITRVEVPVNLDEFPISPSNVLLPRNGGVLKVALLNEKLCLFIEHDVAAKKEKASIFIYKNGQEFKFREGEQYIGSFFKDQVGHHVYLGEW